MAAITSKKVQLFKDCIDKRTEMSIFMHQIRKQWSDDDFKRAKDLQKYVLDKEDAWVLDKAFADFVRDILTSTSAETKIRLMRLFTVCTLKESFVHLLNQDRENRFIMNYLNGFAILSVDEQKAASLFTCHLFSNPQTQSWALYFSEWSSNDCTDGDFEMTSNARVTCKVARMSLENFNPTLQSYGAAIAYNIAIRNVRVMQRPASLEKDVEAHTAHSSLSNSGTNGMATLRAYDAIALELCLCIIELLNKGTFKLVDEVLSHCLQALANFVPLVRSDLDHYHSTFQSDLKHLSDKKLSNLNEKLVRELIAQL